MKFKFAKLIVGIVSLTACLNTSEREGTDVQKQSIPSKKIELAQLEGMFDEMKNNTKYDMK